MTSTPLGTNTFVQVGLVVRDIEAAAKAWAELLGLPVPPVSVTDLVDVAHTEYQQQPTPARAKLAFLKLGQVSLELIEPLGEPSTWNDQLASHGESLHHLAFVVQGLAERLPGLAAAGMPVVQRGDYKGGRYVYLDARERLGAVVELLEND
jgi:methylmalonyl-CoA/ethylmalonyl-CoA epimerase